MSVDLRSLSRDVQGNILRAYGREYRFVRQMVLGVADAVAARAALAVMVDGDRSTPQVTSGALAPKAAQLPWCLNLGFTYQGLRALGVPGASLRTFPPEFAEGMASRAGRLGDIGESAPEHWTGGLGDPWRVHLIVTVYGRTFADVEQASAAVLDAGAFHPVASFDGHALEDSSGRRIVHFGYVDGISQPRFDGIHDSADLSGKLALAPLGVVLLGHPTALPSVMWRVPQPDILGSNGSFCAFRLLEQDVEAFEGYLATAAAEHSCSAELVAAKLCGRWRNGVPLSLAPTEDEAFAYHDSRDAPDLNDFDYVDDDNDGNRCPMGAHIRRCNPRRAHIVQRAANRTRALVRRGMPYGPPYDPSSPGGAARGLLGNFVCASLAAQFEALQYDWLNLGFQDPRITGTNDPLTGANEAATSSFLWPREGEEAIVLRRLPRFVVTRGGAYTFLPTIPAIRWIAAL